LVATSDRQSLFKLGIRSRQSLFKLGIRRLKSDLQASIALEESLKSDLQASIAYALVCKMICGCIGGEVALRPPKQYIFYIYTKFYMFLSNSLQIPNSIDLKL
jgi:hypothetical protein